jgi:flagellar hook protein FlgE
MSLYGALFSGVSSLSSESSAMGAIADNISNVNTIGYKGTDVNFNTLVTNQVSVTQYSPGGVESAPRAAVDVQGLLQATSSSTDIAMSGQGFFIVDSVAQPQTEGGQFAYTRAGSFIPNQNGYLQNASGFYLMGWPLTPTDNSTAAKPSEVDINGTTYMTAYKNPDGTFHYINQNIVSPTEMQGLNLNTIGGTAEATSSISLGANLPSGDPIFNPNNTTAGGVHDSNVLVYDSLGDSTNAQFTWTKQAANAWSLAVTPPAGAAVATVFNNTSATAGPLVYSSQGQLEFNNLPPDGSYFQISSGTPSATNPVVQVQFFDSSKGQVNPTSDTPTTINGVNNVSVLGVDLNGITGTSNLTQAIVKTIQTVATQPYTVASTGNVAPLPSGGPTLNMSSVLLGGVADGANRFISNGGVLQIVQEPGANALNVNCVSNDTTGLGSSIVESGTNVGTSGPSGANLGQFTVPAVWAGGTVNEPSSYSQLVTGSSSFTVAAAAVPPTGNLTIGPYQIPWAEIASGVITSYNDLRLPAGDDTVTTDPSGNPLGIALTVGGVGTAADCAQNAADTINGLATLGLLDGYQASLPGGAGTATVQITVAGSTVDPKTGIVTSTPSAATYPVLADQGGATGEVTWADGKDGTKSEMTGATGDYSTPATGITFNGDGTPSEGNNIGLSNAMPGIIPTSMAITWANGSENQVQSPAPNTAQQPQISLNFGSANETNGMTQLGGDYNVNFLQQNGAKFGNFSGVSIGTNGTVTALFDNGVRTPVFQIPVATFPNPDGMSSETGDVYISTTTSGNYTVRQAGTGGSGTVAQSSLESSTVDLGTQFTTMITVQRAYSAAAKVITTTDSMLTDLISIIRQ